MDKVSVLLIIGIAVLLMTGSFIVYDTWIAEDKIKYDVIVYYGDDKPIRQAGGPLDL